MTLSGSQAFGAGFRLIAEKPAAVLAWIGVYLVLGVLPQAALFGWMLADFGAMAMRGAEDMPVEAMLRAQMIAGLLQVVQIVGGLASAAILSCAVMRAMLEPQNSARAYLRLGAQEGLVAAVLAVLGVLLFIVVMLLCLPVVLGGALVAVVAARGGDSAQGVVGVLIGVLAMGGVTAWLCARFLPALPMTFAQRGFRLFESWTLTRGHDWKLIGLFSALTAAVFILELLAFAVLAIPAGIFAALNAQKIQAWMHGDLAPDMGLLAPWIVAAVLMFALLGVLLNVVAFAPWVDVYRQLTERAAPSD